MGPGALGIEVIQNLALAPRIEVGDTELTVSYSLIAGGFSLTFELNPP